MPENSLTKNLNFVNSNIDKLLNLYRNKFILVHNEEVVGSFDNYENAAEEGVKNYGIEGDFLVYQITQEKPINYISAAII
jgi:hypothetical protein